ncbi:hypothetical protein IAT40_002114 [Kwoniella sp. CBS 6097]
MSAPGPTDGSVNPSMQGTSATATDGTGQTRYTFSESELNTIQQATDLITKIWWSNFSNSPPEDQTDLARRTIRSIVLGTYQGDREAGRTFDMEAFNAIPVDDNMVQTVVDRANSALQDPGRSSAPMLPSSHATYVPHEQVDPETESGGQAMPSEEGNSRRIAKPTGKWARGRGGGPMDTTEG